MGYRERFVMYIKKDLWKDLIYDIVGSVLYSIAIYYFASNQDFAPGGVSGMALIICHFIPVPIGALTLLINVPLILISYKYLGIGFLFKSVKSMTVFSLIVDYIFTLFPQYSGSPILAAVFCGAFGGLGLSFLYRRGSSSGGTDFLTLTLKKIRPHWSIGKIMLSIDAIVIISGAFVFGNIDAVLYGCICTVCGSTVLDRILNSISSGKILLIFSDMNDLLECRLQEVLKIHTAQKDGKRMMVGCKSSDVKKIEYLVYELDPNASLYVLDYEEAFGKGNQAADLENFINPYR